MLISERQILLRMLRMLSIILAEDLKADKKYLAKSQFVS